jgi:hypothetical protein
MDAFVDCIQPGPATVTELFARTQHDGINLTRKRVKPHALLKPSVDGALTGTIYFGHRANADVTARVYDKQAERIEKRQPDPGPLTRYELTLRSGVGISLVDVWDPTAAFWSFASPGLLPRPEGVPDWAPHGGGMLPGGFTLEKAEYVRSTYDRMRAALERSPDLARLVELARREPAGRQVLEFAFAGYLAQVLPVPGGSEAAGRLTKQPLATPS